MPEAADKPQARLYIQQVAAHTFSLHAEFSTFSGDPERVLLEFWKDWKPADAVPDRINPLLSGGSWTVTYPKDGIYRPAVRITDEKGRSSFVQSAAIVAGGAASMGPDPGPLPTIEKPANHGPFTFKFFGDWLEPCPIIGGPANPWNNLGAATSPESLAAFAGYLPPAPNMRCLALPRLLEPLRGLAPARDAFEASVELWTPEGRRRAEWRRRITSRRTWN